MNRAKTLIAVMSYNMGELLRNCLESIERNAPGMPVVIFDDRSTDRTTLDVLAAYRDRFDVIGASDADNGERKTGRLHANMNRALRYAKERGLEYVWYVQDDMQIVRPIDDDVEKEYSKIFESDEGIAQIRCVFMKSPVVTPDHSSGTWRPAQTGIHYERVDFDLGILDTRIVSVKRLVDKGFQFVPGERNSARRGRALGIRTVFPKNPLFMWLPWPPTSLSRLTPVKRAVNRLTDWLFNVGCHPFRDMTPAEVDVMKARPVEELPYAERFLRLAGRGVAKPWCYEHSYTYPAALMRELVHRRWPWRDVR